MRADGRASKPVMAPGMNVGREGAICEYIESCESLPGSSDDAPIIDHGYLQYDAQIARHGGILPRSPRCAARWKDALMRRFVDAEPLFSSATSRLRPR